MTLDELAAKATVPDLIKIDVEGLEVAVLEKSAVVRGRRPMLYAEVAERNLARYGSTVAEFDRFLRSLGYRMFHNVAERNVAHDEFRLNEMDELSNGPKLYDVLAVCPDDPRLVRVVNLAR
jgi:hypothetical protein